MQLASESWIRKQEFALLEFPVFWQTFYRDFLNCRPKVYLFNTHWLWKYLQNWHQIHPRSKLAIKTFSRRNRIWSSFSADRLDRWSVATNPPYENSLSTLVQGVPKKQKKSFRNFQILGESTKKTVFFGNFSQKGGGVTPIPKTFVKLPSHFWHAKFILRC